MPTLICFGFGYSAEHFVAAFGDRFDCIIGTVRSIERTSALNAQFAGRLKVLAFDGKLASAELKNAVAHADAALVSIPQTETGDPALATLGESLLQAKRLRTIVYLSTVGVYGDFAGAWVDETTAPRADTIRGQKRLAAENAWREFGMRSPAAVAILRLAGIYGPGRNVLVQLARGEARRVAKAGQVFNRIHVVDIAQAIDAALANTARGVFNVADDEPSPPGDPIAFGAQLLGREPPPEIPFAEAEASLSPMALSFWQDCRRVKNDKLKRELGVKLKFPSYREGLRALFAAGQYTA
ncbi:MAG TPA: SDR family oxidoreductase [Xanthobacteraceae bacterium]|jgi:nucleoside-diphosphate-sugar epimerase